jgi:protein-S-isoprenylcysteine O-methyltransferase Ste14
MHHRAFYVILLAAPVEWLVRGRPGGWSELGGAVLFLCGIWGYRHAGGTLGEQLSPLVAPCEPARLVEKGLYRSVRHPMYLAQLAMAFGAPLALGAWVTTILALPFVVIVLRRIRVEEAVLLARIPGYRTYMERTHRLLPHVY